MAGISPTEQEATLNTSIDNAGILLLRKTRVSSLTVLDSAASPFSQLQIEQAEEAKINQSPRFKTRITVSPHLESSDQITQLQDIFAIIVEQLNERAPATAPWYEWTGDAQDEA